MRVEKFSSPRTAELGHRLPGSGAVERVPIASYVFFSRAASMPLLRFLATRILLQRHESATRLGAGGSVKATTKRWPVLAALVIVVALGTSSAAVATSTSTESTKTATVKAVGLSLRYPAGWTVLPVHRMTPQQLKRLRKLNPKLAGLLTQGKQDHVAKGTKFFAKDLDAQSRGDHADNVRVLAASQMGYPRSFDAAKRFASLVAEQVHGQVLVVGSGRRVGGETAYDNTISVPFARSDGSYISVRIGQLYVSRGDRFVVVEVVASDTDAGQAVIDSIFGSVRRT